MSPFTYSADQDALSPALRRVWVDFHEDEALTHFVTECTRRPHTWLDMALLSGLSQITDPYNAHGILGMYPMHLLSTPQWEKLVPASHRGGRLLDIGAGQGFVTEYARPLFRDITAVEVAPSLVKRLRARGFEAHLADITTAPDLFPPESFDVVSLLNVLDRCQSPRTLLAHALSFLTPGGILIVSDPFPLDQTIRGDTTIPTQDLGAHSGTWEACLNELYENVFVSLPLTPLFLTRTPYLYKSVGKPGYEKLDDFVIALTKSRPN